MSCEFFTAHHLWQFTGFVSEAENRKLIRCNVLGKFRLLRFCSVARPPKDKNKVLGKIRWPKDNEKVVCKKCTAQRWSVALTSASLLTRDGAGVNFKVRGFSCILWPHDVR